MDKTYVQFLQIIKCSLCNENINFQEEDNINWNKIFNIARRHKVLPMIYKTVYNNENFKNVDLNEQKILKLSINQIIKWQNLKEESFLNIYKEILSENIKPLVFKGIVLSDLYNPFTQRIYDEEDLLIKQVDFIKCEEILVKNNFRIILEEDKNQNIKHYICEKTGLHLQLRTVLFSKMEDDFQLKNNIFNDMFKDYRILNIKNNKIYTLSLNYHFLYIILYEINHLIHFGIRIRQLCDITMYIKNYHNEIDWKYMWQYISLLGYETLFVNILEICIQYLGLDESYIKYKDEKENYYISIEDLLVDIIDGGMYGKNTENKENELEEFNQKYYTNIKTNLKEILSSKKALKEKHKYLEKHPYLLPLALCMEILKNNKQENKTFIDNNPRNNLFKKYKITN